MPRPAPRMLHWRGRTFDRARPPAGISVTMWKLRFLSINFSLACTALALAAASPAWATSPSLSGVLPPEVTDAFQTGAFALPVPARSNLGTSAIRSEWRVPVILVGYKNYPLHYSA